MPRWAKGLALGLVIGAFGAFFALTSLGDDFERNVGLDWLFQVRGPVAAPPDVAVIAVDDRTGPKIGLPSLLREWPRSTHGRLIDELMRRGAAAIVFDMDFTRPRGEESDLQFARSVAASGRVVLFQRLDGKRQPIIGANGKPAGFVWVEQVGSPIPPLAQAARALAPFPLPKVQVAVYRFWAFKQSAGDAPSLPSTALQLVALDSYPAWRRALSEAGAAGLDRVPASAEAVATPAALKELMLEQRRLFRADPTLAGRVAATADTLSGLGTSDRRFVRALAGLYGGSDHPYLNFYGPPGTIKTISYHAFLTADPAVSEADLDVKGKVVFVGFSDLFDPGQPDRFYSVFTRSDGVDLSGVEIMATAFANLLTASSIQPGGTAVTAASLLVFGIVMCAVIYLLPAMFGVPLGLLLGAGYAAGAQYAFNGANLWLPLATPVILQLPLAMVGGLLGQYLFERREKRRISEELSYYLPEHVLRDLTKGGADAASLNRIVHGTCLASDMAGFTTLAESVSPTELAEFMNAYYEALAEALKRNDVDMTEFHADMIMCAWLSPDDHPAADPRAAIAALDVIEAIRRFGASRDRPLNPRVGMDFGQFYLGHAGGGGHYAFSILGDTANTAARLESLNKHLGTHLLATLPAIDGHEGLLLRPIGDFKLVGKAGPTAIVEVMSRRDDADAGSVELCERFAEALESFRAGDWTGSAQRFEALLTTNSNDGPSRLYLDRARQFAANPPNVADPTVIEMEDK